MRSILTIICFIWSLHCVAQVQVRTNLDRESILIGERIQLSLEAYMPLGETFAWFRIDSIPNFTVINASKIDTIETFNGKKVQQTYTITSFDSGRQQLPAFTMVIGNARYVTDTLGIDVKYAPVNVADNYRDIKEIMDVEVEKNTFIPWIIAIVTLLALLIAGYLLYRKKSPAIKPVAKKLSPYEQAMRDLEMIRKRGFHLNGEVKEYYSSLNDILRVFLEGSLQLHTMEKTNEEIILDLRRVPLSKEAHVELSNALRVADYVKFAKYHPDENLNEQSFNTIKTAIETLNRRMTEQDNSVRNQQTKAQ